MVRALRICDNSTTPAQHGDLDGVVSVHGQVYTQEFGSDVTFETICERDRPALFLRIHGHIDSALPTLPRVFRSQNDV